MIIVIVIQVQFAAYKQFCDDTTVEKTRLIKEAAEKIEVLRNRTMALD